MAVDFSPYQAVLLDLDGTVYHEDHALPGAIELIRRLQSENRKFACLSNATTSPLRVMMRLDRMGVEIDPNNIYTAAAAACDYVVANLPAKDDPDPRRLPRVFNLSTDAVDEMLQGLVGWVERGNQPCDAVIIGTPADSLATHERQLIALQLLRRGATAIGVSADRVYPSPRGLEIGSGAFTWMLAYAAGVEPVFCGKPQPIFFEELCRRLEVDPGWCLLVGDNLESDVLGGKSQGMRTILSMSGVTRRRDLENLPEEMKPDLVVENLAELL